MSATGEEQHISEPEYRKLISKALTKVCMSAEIMDGKIVQFVTATSCLIFIMIFHGSFSRPPFL